MFLSQDFGIIVLHNKKVTKNNKDQDFVEPA
jgi:hypothetical protein